VVGCRSRGSFLMLGMWPRAVVLSILNVVLLIGCAPMVALAQSEEAVITSPKSGAVVRGVVMITGTAIHSRFSFYKVEYAVEPGENWVVIQDVQPNQVRDGPLIQWDTRAVPDGSYSLRLVVVDETGNYIQDVVRRIVVANAGWSRPYSNDRH